MILYHIILQIWSDSRMLHNIDIEALDQHGKIYEESMFKINVFIKILKNFFIGIMLIYSVMLKSKSD